MTYDNQNNDYFTWQFTLPSNDTVIVMRLKKQNKQMYDVGLNLCLICTAMKKIEVDLYQIENLMVTSFRAFLMKSLESRSIA